MARILTRHKAQEPGRAQRYFTIVRFGEPSPALLQENLQGCDPEFRDEEGPCLCTRKGSQLALLRVRV